MQVFFFGEAGRVNFLSTKEIQGTFFPVLGGNFRIFFWPEIL